MWQLSASANTELDLNLPTPLLPLGTVNGVANVFVKDESAMPTGTFKDRLASAALERFPGHVVLGSISYGNTALSLARAVHGRVGCDAVAFLPADFDEWVLGPSTSGRSIRGRDIGDVLRAAGTYVAYVDLETAVLGDAELRAVVDDLGFRGNRPFVNVSEGLDTRAYAPVISEALDQLDMELSTCIVQFGTGVLADDVLAVLAERSPSTTVVPISTPRRDSLARMLYGPRWIDTRELARVGYTYRHSTPSRRGSGLEPYRVYLVSEVEVADGLRVARSYGLSAEPSGAAGLGILHRVGAFRPSQSRAGGAVLVINTGNGIDAVAAGVDWANSG